MVTQLLTGIGGPLSTEVSHPGGCGIDLIVEGELGWIKPVGDVQVAALAHNEAAAWRVGKKISVKMTKIPNKGVVWPNRKPLVPSGGAVMSKSEK